MQKANLLPSLGEGFRLIGREPLSVLAWGGVNLIAVLIPVGIYWLFLGPQMMEFYGDMAQSAGSDNIPQPPSFGGVGALVQLLQYVGSIVAAAFIYAGVYRAVLRPQERGFGHMKFGSDEFNVGVVFLVLMVLLVIVSIIGTVVVVLPISIITAIAASGGGGLAMAALVPILIIILMIAMILLFSRFGMALPMTFAEGKIRIFEAWTFTKGYAGQLFLMAFLQFLIVLGLYLAALLVIFGVAMGGFIGLDPGSMDTLFDGPDVLQRFMPAIIVGLLLYTVAIFVITPIMMAPWAKAYQLIAGHRMDDRTQEVFS